MNNDLISREALKKALKRNCTPELCHDYNTDWCEKVCPHNHFEDLINDAPTVEPENERALDLIDNLKDRHAINNREMGILRRAILLNENTRPQGKWVYRNDNPLIPSGYYECNVCEIGKSLTEQNYCPYCGAQMNGGENHD